MEMDSNAQTGVLITERRGEDSDTEERTMRTRQQRLSDVTQGKRLQIQRAERGAGKALYISWK